MFASGTVTAKYTDGGRTWKQYKSTLHRLRGPTSPQVFFQNAKIRKHADADNEDYAQYCHVTNLLKRLSDYVQWLV